MYLIFNYLNEDHRLKFFKSISRRSLVMQESWPRCWAKSSTTWKIAVRQVSSKPWMVRFSRIWEASNSSNTRQTSSITASSFANRSVLTIGPRSANSLSRSRLSSAPPIPCTIHCRRLPQRWSKILPALLLCWLGRHQTSSSLSSRQGTGGLWA